MSNRSAPKLNGATPLRQVEFKCNPANRATEKQRSQRQQKHNITAHSIISWLVLTRAPRELVPMHTHVVLHLAGSEPWS